MAKHQENSTSGRKLHQSNKQLEEMDVKDVLSPDLFKPMQLGTGVGPV